MPTQAEMNRMLDYMAQVESANNPRAYNHKEKALGLYQIRPAAVADLNRYYKRKGLPLRKHEDFYDPSLARQAVIDYGNMYGAITPEEFMRTWNGGPQGRRRIKATQPYVEKFRKIGW